MSTHTLSDFEAQVGAAYRINLDSGTAVDLDLISATSIATAMPSSSDDGRPFSLLFRGPTDYPFEQGIKRLVHGDEEVLEVFLVPIQPDAEGPLYEAVFA